MAVEEEEVEGYEACGDQRCGEEVDLFAAQALLEFGERDGSAVAPADDFAVEDEVGGDFAKGWKEFGEFGDAVEGAGVDLHLWAALVDLGADAVEFFFYERACGECGDQVGGAVYGTG